MEIDSATKIVVKDFDSLTNNELYQILRCRAEVFGIEQEILYIDPDNLDQKSIHIFAVNEGTIAAYARVIPPGIKYPPASIGRLLTLRPFRDRGLARRIMNRAVEIALGLSSEIRIEAQAYLKEFYLGLGFKAVSDTYILEGLPHITMTMAK